MRSPIPREKFGPVLLPFHVLCHFLPYTQRQRNCWREEGWRSGSLFKCVSPLGSSSTPLLHPGQHHDPWWGEHLEICGEVFVVTMLGGHYGTYRVGARSVSHPAVCWGVGSVRQANSQAEKHHSGLSCPGMALRPSSEWFRVIQRKRGGSPLFLSF
ncbi:hypothetical protein HJG60_008477 [Phyllostomus discolor]|uniref:Uncharacterized protein n=1 Tax=Phyllostomus discolor TaxID=89673 RepID=A0A833Z782_9CHIR|nr:hypothetical protein HJG60_008477 [Phyllostomus discolor]